VSDVLRDLYRRLDGALAPASGNPCGSCFACCTGPGLTVQNVLSLEIEHLADRYGRPAAETFAAYAERRRDERGGLLHEVCPFYEKGCTIYPDRPYSCRVFGHFKMRGTALPEGCVFEPSVRAVSGGGYFKDVPLSRELRDLQRQWDARRPRRPDDRVESPEELLARVKANIDPLDPSDLALVAQMEGRIDEAVALIEQACVERPDDPFVHLARGNLLDEVGRGVEARGAYQRSLALDDSNVRAWMHLGFASIEQGDPLEARSAFAHAVERQPDDGISRGFLGWLMTATARSMDEVRRGAEHLAVAVRLNPDNAMFHLRLAEALLIQGFKDEAEPHLAAAVLRPTLIPAVEALRARWP
jgi:tetratricopeptide (TPR) repeat protein